MAKNAFDKAAMLPMIKASWTALTATIAQFDPTTLETPRSTAGWSIKDLMAHITFWEGYALRLFTEVNRGERAQILGEITEDDLNQINAKALAEGRAKALADVQTAFEAVHHDLMTMLKALPDEFEEAWWSLWPSKAFPHNLIVWNTYDHYDEHHHDLQQWL